jgi:hypothetical protein
MELGGPAGRDAVLAIDTAPLEPAARAYVESIRGDAKKVNYGVLAKSVKKISRGPGRLADAKLQVALDRMEERNGQDDETSPAAILNSGLDGSRLLDQLKRVRARSFRRENNHVFADLPVTNALINALQYRNAEKRRD